MPFKCHFYPIVILVLLSGCAQLKEAFTASQGNAVYQVQCPVLLPDGSGVATYTDEAGKVHPVLATFTVNSGRVLSGGVNVDIPNCISLDAPKLEQGEDRSQGFLQGLGNIGRAILKAIGL